MQTTPPLSSQSLEFKMPRTEALELADGTPVYLIPNADAELISFTVYLRSGAAHDSTVGATAFAAELLTRGTQQKKVEELDEAIESRGCSIRASGGQTSMHISAFGLAEHLDFMIDVVSECLSQPRFDSDELETVRGRWMSEMSINMRDPDWLAGQASNMVCYPNHPYRNSRQGMISQMAAITREQMVEAYNRLLQSERAVVIAGPVDVATVSKRFSLLTTGLPKPSFDSYLPQAHALERSAVIAPNPEAVQSAFRIALPAVGYNHPDFSALQLVTNVLGGYTLARLFSILREQKGYTYGAYSVPSIRRHAQTIDVVTSVGNEYTADTVVTLHGEIQRLANEAIADEELEFARQQILGSFARSNETPQQTASLVWNLVQYGLPADYYERHVRKLQMFRPEELRLVQQRYFDVNRWSVGCSGKEDLLRAALADYVSDIDTWSPTTDVNP